MAATGYSLSEIVTQKHTTDAKRLEAARELAYVADAFCEQLVTLGWQRGPAQQLTAVVMAGISGGKRAE